MSGKVSVVHCWSLLIGGELDLHSYLVCRSAKSRHSTSPWGREGFIVWGAPVVGNSYTPQGIIVCATWPIIHAILPSCYDKPRRPYSEFRAAGFSVDWRVLVGLRAHFSVPTAAYSGPTAYSEDPDLVHIPPTIVHQMPQSCHPNAPRSCHPDAHSGRVPISSAQFLI